MLAGEGAAPLAPPASLTVTQPGGHLWQQSCRETAMKLLHVQPESDDHNETRAQPLVKAGTAARASLARETGGSYFLLQAPPPSRDHHNHPTVLSHVCMKSYDVSHVPELDFKDEFLSVIRRLLLIISAHRQ